VLLLRTGTLSRAILPGARLSKKRSRSGKFSNAITPPPCVCLDKGIMRFYASHACFVDLQRCLCTQRHTSRLPASSFSSSVFSPSGKNDPPYAVSTRSPIHPCFPALRYIFLVPIFLEKDPTTTLIQGVVEIRARCYLRKCANHGFLNTRRNTVGADRTLKIFSNVSREEILEIATSILNLSASSRSPSDLIF